MTPTAQTAPAPLLSVGCYFLGIIGKIFQYVKTTLANLKASDHAYF
ncbi:MAG: hypothetical protein KME49_12695 [Brasilonema octagenarum HA4186-MV1]|jgi:hypothetical protein|nr:hypothetical protein [Brasilonema octagenarum]MBW4626327.1 hypothetical protein [Brasilonema octagenarum HA4186-MV1]